MKNKLMVISLVALVCIAVVLALMIFVESLKQPATVPGETDVLINNTPSPAPTTEPTERPTEGPTPFLPLSGLVIGIDAGHQEKANLDKEPCAPWDETKNPNVNNKTMKTKTASGTVGRFSGVPEYVTTLEISLKVKAKLESLGATVVMTRETSDVDLSNIDRAQIFNNAGCDVAIRIHCNGVEKESVNGVEAWVRGNGDGTAEYIALGEYEKSLAEELLAYFCASTDANKRNVNRSDSYTGTNWSTVPSIILECGFASNEEEDLKMNSPVYQELIAQGIANWLQNSRVLVRKEA